MRSLILYSLQKSSRKTLPPQRSASYINNTNLVFIFVCLFCFFILSADDASSCTGNPFPFQRLYYITNIAEICQRIPRFYPQFTLIFPRFTLSFVFSPKKRHKKTLFLSSDIPDKKNCVFYSFVMNFYDKTVTLILILHGGRVLYETKQIFKTVPCSYANVPCNSFSSQKTCKGTQ